MSQTMDWEQVLTDSFVEEALQEARQKAFDAMCSHMAYMHPHPRAVLLRAVGADKSVVRGYKPMPCTWADALRSVFAFQKAMEPSWKKLTTGQALRMLHYLHGLRIFMQQRIDEEGEGLFFGGNLIDLVVPNIQGEVSRRYAYEAAKGWDAAKPWPIFTTGHGEAEEGERVIMECTFCGNVAPQVKRS